MELTKKGKQHTFQQHTVLNFQFNKRKLQLWSVKQLFLLQVRKGRELCAFREKEFKKAPMVELKINHFP